MKKIFLHSLLAVMVLAGLLVGTGKVSALPGTAWATGIKIQNLTDSVTGSDAGLEITVYDASGSPVTTISTTATGDTLTALKGKSVEVYLPNYNFGSGTFSAVVSSTAKIGAVVTNSNYAYGLADSYNSMDPANSISVPYVYHNHNGWSTEIFIQNTSIDTAITDLTVTLKEPASSASASDGAVTQVVPLNIPANGSAVIDTADAQFGTGGQYPLGWFIGSATVSSPTIKVAVAFNQIRLVGASDAKGNVMISGRGSTSADGATAGGTISLPSLYKEFTGASGTWRSGIKLQNLDTTCANTASAEVTFTSDNGVPNFANGTNSSKVTVNIQGCDNTELYLANVVLDDSTAIPDMWKGSATINIKSGTGPIVATVQHTNYSGAGGYGVAMGYGGFSIGASQISLPTLYVWPSGAGVWVSGIKIQNIGGGSTNNGQVTAHVEFIPDPDSIDKTTGNSPTLTLDANTAAELYLTSANTLSNGGSIPSGWKGSAIVKIDTGDSKIVATVINTNYGRHVATMYTGISTVP